jgi:hypothetical protein
MNGSGLGAGWLVLGVGSLALASGCGATHQSTGKDSGTDGGSPQAGAGRSGKGGSVVIEGGAFPIEGGAPSVEGGAPSVEGGAPAGGEPGVDPCAGCSVDQVCSAGRCRDIVCTPDSSFCADGKVWKCDALGADKSLLQKCRADEYCLEQGEAAECSPTKCKPNDPLCVGQVATQCRADGSGPQGGGKDCAANGEVCYDGACLTQACTPGQKLCQHDDVYFCGKNGASAELFEDCSDDEVCNESSATCRRKLCSPGTLSCDRSRVVTCNALGLGWQQTGPDCSVTNAVCVAGSCKPQTCTPNTSYCQDSTVVVCDANGVAAIQGQPCPESQYCSTLYGYAACLYDVCTANTPSCDGNVPTTCKADGSGLVPGGSPCDAGSVCSYGACQAPVCQAYQYFCQNNAIAYCWGDGVTYNVQQACGDGAVCDVSEAAPACKPFDCKPGDESCLKNQVGTCADGFTLASVSADCAGAQQVCSANGQCAATSVDTLGSADELTSINDSDLVVGDAIKVLSNRTLTQLEVNLTLPAARDLTFLVYRQTANGLVQTCSQTPPAKAGSGYFSSGTMACALVAGNDYFLGVSVSGGSLGGYYDHAPWSGFASFGSVIGAFSMYRSSPSRNTDASFVYDLRFTTAP